MLKLNLQSSLPPVHIQRIRYGAAGFFALALALVLYLSLSAITSGPGLGSDKVGHFLAYGTLIVLWFIANNRRLMRISGLVGLFIFGTVMELLQGAVPGRDPSLGDVMANSIGLLMGVMAVRGMLAVPILSDFAVSKR